MNIKEFDHVVLSDGREGAVVEMLDSEYLVDVGSSPLEWDTVRVEEGEIVRVIRDEQLI